MKKFYFFGRTAVIASAIFAVCALRPVSVSAIVWNDPASVVEQWSNASTYPKVIDINFSDTSWPNTWGNFGTSEKCPELTDGVYVNASLSTPVVTSPEVMYPINFHNCTFTLIVITYIILKIMGMARLFPVIIFGGTLSVVVAIAGKSRSCS